MKHKGFTLIELLAVIVILAILALIAIPIVINIINDSRENAHKRSIETYARQLEQAYLNAKLEAKTDPTKGVPTTIEELEKLVKTSGEKVKCDSFSIEEEGIQLTNCRVVDKEGKQKSKYRYDYIAGKLIKLDSEENENKSYANYNIGDEITDKTNNEKYYVISNSPNNQDYVVALKAEPLTYDEVSSYDSEHIKHNGYNGTEAGAKNHEGYASLSYYGSNYCYTTDHSGENYGCRSDYNQSDIIYVVNMWCDSKFKSNELKEINDNKARLITKNEYEGINNYNWSYLNYDQYTNYWTMSPYDSQHVWVVNHSGELSYSITYSYYYAHLIRPVINLRKEYIK